MAKPSIDLILSFGNSSTAKDGEIAYNGLVKQLSQIPGGIHSVLNVSLFNLDSKTIRVSSNLDKVANGVVATPHTPPPHPPIFPPGNFDVMHTAYSGHGLVNARNFSSGKVIYNLQSLKTTLSNIAAGNGLY